MATGQNDFAIRRLGPGDERVVEQLATRAPQTALLNHAETFFLVAFDGDDPIGFVLAHELPRRHGPPTQLLVYEVETSEQYRRRGVARRLLRELERLGRERGVAEAWVLTEPDNEPANGLYASLGGIAQDVVEWDLAYEGG